MSNPVERDKEEHLLVLDFSWGCIDFGPRPHYFNISLVSASLGREQCTCCDYTDNLSRIGSVVEEERDDFKKRTKQPAG